jgi:hypothetical protein
VLNTNYEHQNPLDNSLFDNDQEEIAFTPKNKNRAMDYLSDSSTSDSSSELGNFE